MDGTFLLARNGLIKFCWAGLVGGADGDVDGLEDEAVADLALPSKNGLSRLLWREVAVRKGLFCCCACGGGLAEVLPTPLPRLPRPPLLPRTAPEAALTIDRRTEVHSRSSVSYMGQLQESCT